MPSLRDFGSSTFFWGPLATAVPTAIKFLQVADGCLVAFCAPNSIGSKPIPRWQSVPDKSRGSWAFGPQAIGHIGNDLTCVNRIGLRNV